MSKKITVAVSENDGVDVVFEEQSDGRITMSFEGGTEDADPFMARLALELAIYKGELADEKRRAQVKRDRTERLRDLKAKQANAKEKGADLPQAELFTDGDQAELDHLTKLKANGEL